MNIKRAHTAQLIEWGPPPSSVCYSDNGMTAAEQATLDADQAAEVTEVQEQAPAQTGDNAGTEGQQTGDPAGQEQPQRQGMVPHAALHEERTRRQETEKALNEERRLRQTVEERTNLILQRFAQPQQQAQPQQTVPEIPAFDADPAGHILGQVRQQGAILNELVQVFTNQHRQNEAATSDRDLAVHAATLESQYASEHPEYAAAAEHLLNSRRQELIDLGWTNPAELHKQMSYEARDISRRALSLGKNPAELIHSMAKHRGFMPPAAEQAANGATAEDGLRTIAAGQQQSRSVGNMRGSGPGPLTAAKLAEMSAEDFSKMMETKEGRDLMGV